MKITAISFMILVRSILYFEKHVENLIDFEYMFYFYLSSILYRIVYLTFYGKHSLQGIVWTLKIMTDMNLNFTKIIEDTKNYIDIPEKNKYNQVEILNYCDVIKKKNNKQNYTIIN